MPLVDYSRFYILYEILVMPSIHCKQMRFSTILMFFILYHSTSSFGLNHDNQVEDRIIVTLIGTGAPPVDANRMGPCVLVEVADQKLIFDAGRGISVNIDKHGLQLADITAVFFTHLHGDHVLGFPDVWLSSYHKTNGHRQEPLKTYGPKGLAEMTNGLELTYKGIIDAWGLAESKPGFEVTEFYQEGTIFEDGKLIITAFEVDHSEEPAYGFRIDYGSKSVVISGDTGYSDNLIKYAMGTDLLVHEIFHETRIFNKEWLMRLGKTHTLPEVAAKVFDAVKPKVAVAYHLGAESKTLNDTMKNLYTGVFYAGEDLMTFEVADEVRLINP